MYKGQAVSVRIINNELAELVLDLEGQSVNKLNKLTLKELGEAVAVLASASQIKGLLVSSAKSEFVVGADITEFQESFALSDAELTAWIKETNDLFCTLENLPYPSVSAINGMALGGGFELALATDFRVLSNKAKVGLPEVNLGICPGWGGTVRLSRLIGLENALKWLMQGKPQSASNALEAGAVDKVVDHSDVREEALALLTSAVNGELDYTKNSARKHTAIEKAQVEGSKADELKAQFGKRLDPNYPAAATILSSVLEHAALPFQDALAVETAGFVTLAKGEAAQNLVALFMNDQLIKKKAKSWIKQSDAVEKSAVLGAGIMGGGIAYQSASTGTPIVMKDINDSALDLGMTTAAKLLDKKIEKGRLDQLGKEQIMAAIDPTLDYENFSDVGVVVEAVVENPKIKAAVLSEVEKKVADSAVIASNTSTISIDQLAESVQRPEQFCGMHFFNPVHLMPLVEVIRGSKTSDAAVAKTVAYASNMGKTPIVVNDCPGFLVNRILFPYFNGFNRLLKDGVDFQRIDAVMEKFGWPMGPAYLADVVGIDTMVHADEVMQEGFPERMGHEGATIVELLLEKECLGQKNGIGFYQYGTDENGRRFKEPSGLCRELIASQTSEVVEVTDQEIIDRMMIPMCLEAVRCLEDGIVDTAAEADMGLILGLGFPRFRGGALRYIDGLGLDVFAAKAESNAKHGPLYQLTEGYKARLAENQKYYS